MHRSSYNCGWHHTHVPEKEQMYVLSVYSRWILLTCFSQIFVQCRGSLPSLWPENRLVFSPTWSRLKRRMEMSTWASSGFAKYVFTRNNWPRALLLIKCFRHYRGCNYRPRMADSSWSNSSAPDHWHDELEECPSWVHLRMVPKSPSGIYSRSWWHTFYQRGLWIWEEYLVRLDCGTSPESGGQKIIWCGLSHHWCVQWWVSVSEAWADQ